MSPDDGLQRRETDINNYLSEIFSRIERNDCDTVCQEEVRQELSEIVQEYEEASLKHKANMYYVMDNHILPLIPGTQTKGRNRTTINELFKVQYFFRNELTGEESAPRWRFGPMSRKRREHMLKMSDHDFSLLFTEEPPDDNTMVVPKESFLEWQINYSPKFLESLRGSGVEFYLPQRITGRVKHFADIIDKGFRNKYGVNEFPVKIPKKRYKSKKKKKQQEALEALAEKLQKRQGYLEGVYDALGIRIILKDAAEGDEPFEKAAYKEKRQIELFADRLAASIDQNWISEGKKLSDFEVADENIPEEIYQDQNRVVQTKNYITNPKGGDFEKLKGILYKDIENLYMSYHKNILFGGSDIEVQIRTEGMHEMAENEDGWAGHDGRKFVGNLQLEQFNETYPNLGVVYNRTHQLMAPEKKQLKRYKSNVFFL